MDIYKAARERIAADFDKGLMSATKPSDTAEEIIAECKDAIDQINALSNYVMGVK